MTNLGMVVLLFLEPCHYPNRDDTTTIRSASAHAAASLGIPTVILLPRVADWLWGPSVGTSPWYAFAELLRDDDREGLAARLAGC